MTNNKMECVLNSSRRLWGCSGLSELFSLNNLSLVVRKPVFRVFNQVPHKPGCTATEDGLGLEIWYIGSRGIDLRSENKHTDQLLGYSEADLRLCFRICKKLFFPLNNLSELTCFNIHSLTDTKRESLNQIQLR